MTRSYDTAISATKPARKRIGRRQVLAAGIRSSVLVGSSGFLGLSLPGLLQAEEAASTGSSQRAIINIHLDGGPPQMDTIDLKPSAPAEIRGEFQPINTSLPGLQICEHLPRIASLADRFVFIRSLVGSAGAHNAFQCQSGFGSKEMASVGGRPAMGCVINKLRGRSTDETPAFVDMMQGRPLVRNSARPGFLGPSYKPFRPDMSQWFARPLEAGMKKELAAKGAEHTVSLQLNQALSESRLQQRGALLARLDRIRQEMDNSGMMAAMDRFNQQATGILLSGKFAEAMDLASEKPSTLARYDLPNAGPVVQATSDSANATRKLLIARRLVEAGVRVVSVTFSDFDTHSANFPRMRYLLPIVDHAIGALVADLSERGMLDDVSIVVWGEFGRTPRIDTKSGGRHHWPRVGMCMLAGGGMPVGQVIGATDRTAGSPVRQPITYKDVFATLYRNLGIDPLRTTIADPSGRPQYLLDSGGGIFNA